MSEFSGRRVVMMTAQDWPGLYMASMLARRGLLSAVVVQKEPLDGIRWSYRGLRRASSKNGMKPALEAFLGFRQGVPYALRRLSDPRGYPYLTDLIQLGVAVHEVPDFLSQESHELLRRLEPEITVICGTPILPDSLLSIARVCTVNTHTSVLPYYRGGGSLFWPLFFRDTEKLGFTIHKAVAQVDAGPYFHQEAIPLEPGDTAPSLARKAFLRATEKMIELLQTSPLDRTAWKEYEKPLRHSWRYPDSDVKRYVYGPTARQRAISWVKNAAWALKVNPFSRRTGKIATFFFHRAIADGTPAHDWRRIMGNPTVSELREQLLYVKQKFQIISVKQALELIDRKEPLDRDYAVITADDGYRDFLTQYVPLAEELDIPSTLFVCTGAVDSGSVWFQKLYDLIDGISGDRLYLPWADRRIYFGDARHRVITVERLIAPYLKRLNRTNRQQRIADLYAANSVNFTADPADAFCTPAELRQLAASSLIELHLHSHHHDPFDSLNEQELTDDITACRQYFKTTLGQDSNVLSYPNGRWRADHETVLRRLGIRHAFLATFGIEQPPTTHPYAISRVGMDSTTMADLHWNVCKALHA